MYIEAYIVLVYLLHLYYTPGRSQDPPWFLFEHILNSVQHPGWLFKSYGVKLPNYVGIIINHQKGSWQTNPYNVIPPRKLTWDLKMLEIPTGINLFQQAIQLQIFDKSTIPTVLPLTCSNFHVTP